MQIEKIIDAASELKIAKLRAKAQGITDYNEYEDCFNVFNDENFKVLAKDREYTVRKRSVFEFDYEYVVTIRGLVFRDITNKLLFAGDEEKLQEDKDV